MPRRCTFCRKCKECKFRTDSLTLKEDQEYQVRNVCRDIFRYTHEQC